jgi:hypothetical protein
MALMLESVLLDNIKAGVKTPGDSKNKLLFTSPHTQHESSPVELYATSFHEAAVSFTNLSHLVSHSFKAAAFSETFMEL